MTPGPDSLPPVAPVEALTQGPARAESIPPGEVGDGMPEPIERLGFRVGDLHLVCPLEWVSGVSPPPALHRIPNLPAWMRGAANLRGDVAPVADLARLAGVQGRPERPMLVVFGQGEARVGVLTDDAPDIRAFVPDQLLDPLPPVGETLRPHLLAAYRQGETVWLEVDIPGMVEAAV